MQSIPSPVPPAARSMEAGIARGQCSAMGSAGAPEAASAQGAMHLGMPPLDLSGPPLACFEFWPTWLFYIPIALQWLFLSLRHRSLTLPTVANPLFPAGDLCGSSKTAILSQVAASEAREWFAPHVTVTRSRWVEGDRRRALARLAAASLALPVVAKPDIGCRGVGVRLIESEADLNAYLAGFPQGENIILQRYIPHEGEAGVFYIRLPGEAHGQIFSLGLKYFPYVAGDGRSTLKELILSDPRAGRIAHLYLPRHAARLDEVIPAGETFRLAFAGNHFRGAIFRNGNAYVTRAMTERFDEIARAIPEFYFGRFDVRFPTIEDLQRGEHFTILEINGASAGPGDIYDRNTRLLDAYRTLIRQFSLLFEIARRNRARGFQPVGLLDLLRLFRREQRLTQLYPLTQ